MSTAAFSQLAEVHQQQGPAAAIDKLIETLRAGQDFHHLFDALLLRKKHELGLPLTHPTSFDDVPSPLRTEFEKSYVEAAREVGEALLSQQSIGQAWMYLRTIREPDKVAQALEALDPQASHEEELIDIALYQGVAPVKGLQLMLASHGTCSSITALDQQFSQFSPDVRMKCAAVLARRLYDDLCQTLQHEVERKQGLTPPGQSLRELIGGRDWLFADDNYHVDVSHLHAVVRFSRSLDESSPELKLALQLAEYGSKLAPHYQYAGDPPFQEFYPAHIQYFKAVSGEGREAALAYFREKLGSDVNDPDTQLAALGLLDLLTRLGHLQEALDLAAKYLVGAQDRFGFSFADLCQRAGRFDTLLEVAREKGDLITYTAALLQAGARPA
jgi:hypothetical protein